MEYEGSSRALMDEIAAIARNVGSVILSFRSDQLFIIECGWSRMRWVWGYYNHGIRHT